MTNTLLASGIPVAHHPTLEKLDADLGAGGSLISEIIALWKKFGPVILKVLPQIIAIIQSSGGNWQSVLAQIAILLAGLIPAPVPPVTP
jgi:hypothetical protein